MMRLALRDVRQSGDAFEIVFEVEVEVEVDGDRRDASVLVARARRRLAFSIPHGRNDLGEYVADVDADAVIVVRARQHVAQWNAAESLRRFRRRSR